MQSTSSSAPNSPDQHGLEDITVIVNGQGAHRRKRFQGQLLVRWLQPTKNEEGTEILNVYRTAKRHYALHTRTIQDWDFSEGDPDYWGNPKNWGVKNELLLKFMGWGHNWDTFKESGDYSFQIFEMFEALRYHVSDDLFKAVSQAMDGPEIEDLISDHSTAIVHRRPCPDHLRASHSTCRLTIISFARVSRKRETRQCSFCLLPSSHQLRRLE